MFNGLKRRTRLVRKTAVRKKRPGTRRGEPTPAEKEQKHGFIYELSRGMCELRLHPQCSGNRVLPRTGSVFERWHLVHVRAKRRFGWPTTGEWRMRGGCFWCHSVAVHSHGVKIPPLLQDQ